MKKAISAMVLLYLIISFVGMELDPRNWTELTRAILMLGGVLAWLFNSMRLSSIHKPKGRK